MNGMEANAATRRWYLSAPAWLVWGAALATGLLYAAERWRFSIAYYKGWPVLLAVAVVGAVLLLIPAWMLAALLFRRRVRFGLRTLLVFVTLCAVVCSWLGVRIKQAGRQAEAVEAFGDGLRGFSYSPVPPPEAEPLRKVLGTFFFADVDELEIFDEQATNVDLAGLAVLKRVQVLKLYGDELTDASLRHLEGLTNLRVLHLVNTRVTDEGVKKLQHALPECKIKVYRLGNP